MKIGLLLQMLGMILLLLSMALFFSGYFFNYYIFDPSIEGVIIALLFAIGLLLSLFGFGMSEENLDEG